MGIELRPYQLEAVKRMRNGCILCGGVGSGKSRTALAYYFIENGGSINPEKGLAMAISKKALGNKGNYCNEFKKWLPEDEEEEEGTVELRLDTSELTKSLEDLASKLFSNKEK